MKTVIFPHTVRKSNAVIEYFFNRFYQDENTIC